MQSQLMIFQNPDQHGLKQSNIKKQADNFKQGFSCDLDDLVKNSNKNVFILILL